MRHFGYSLQEAEEMTVREYSYMIHAFNLRRVDIERDMHYQAFLNHSVTATKHQGKKTVPVYRKFTDFYDYEERIKELTAPKIDTNKANLARLIAKANSL